MIYEGQWKECAYEGNGKLTFPDGSVIEGDFKDDVPEGRIRSVNSQGEVYEGEASGDAVTSLFLSNFRTNNADLQGSDSKKGVMAKVLNLFKK